VLPFASGELPIAFDGIPRSSDGFSQVYGGGVIVLCMTDLNICSLVDLFIEFPS